MKNETKEKKPPSHAIYVVQGEGESKRWIKIGAAWSNKDGKGMNLIFDALPITNKVVIREFTDKDTDDKGAQQ